MKIRDTSRFGNQKEYEVVEKIPKGFFVWNIGKNMGHDDYIPVCEDLYPDDKDSYEVNTSTLKAIKLECEDVQKLRKAAGWGINSLATARKALKSNRTSYKAKRQKELVELTLEIFEQITE